VTKGLTGSTAAFTATANIPYRLEVCATSTSDTSGTFTLTFSGLTVLTVANCSTVALDNGNVIVAWSDTDGAYYKTYNNVGTQLTTYSATGRGGPINNVSIVSITQGGAVMAWLNDVDLIEGLLIDEYGNFNSNVGIKSLYSAGNVEKYDMVALMEGAAIGMVVSDSCSGDIMAYGFDSTLDALCNTEYVAPPSWYGDFTLGKLNDTAYGYLLEMWNEDDSSFVAGYLFQRNQFACVCDEECDSYCQSNYECYVCKPFPASFFEAINIMEDSDESFTGRRRLSRSERRDRRRL
jgi:hypothetical protein